MAEGTFKNPNQTPQETCQSTCDYDHLSASYRCSLPAGHDGLHELRSADTNEKLGSWSDANRKLQWTFRPSMVQPGISIGYASTPSTDPTKFIICQEVSPSLIFDGAQRFRCGLPHGHDGDHELLGSYDDGSTTVLGAWTTTALSGKAWTKFPTTIAQSQRTANLNLANSSTPRLGWECPRCHSTYAPFVLECKRCAKASTEDKRPSSKAPTIMTSAEGKALRAHLRDDSATYDAAEPKPKYQPRKLSDYMCLRCGTRMTDSDEFEEYQHRTDNCGGLVEYRPTSPGE